MAIQIQYPAIDAVSVQLSASRGSPAKLIVTGGSSGRIGVPFAGKTIGSGSEIAVGRDFTITEHIDNSIYLDQNNIILFRRGMPSVKIVKCMNIVVPQVIISGNAFGASVTFRDITRTFCVDRLRGIDTIGEEDWAENPCAGSQTRYPALQALAIIGAPSSGNFLCSYEGQYRSVLSSIYSDMGCAYWWNFAGGGIGMVCGSGGGDYGPKSGCNIISSVNGSTLEGSRTHSSFVYMRSQAEELRNTSFTRTNWGTFSSSPKYGVLYPTNREILRSIWGGIDAYDDLVAGVPPSSDYINGGIMSLPDISEDKIISEFQSKFGWNPNKSTEENWSRILGIPDIRSDAWGNITNGDDVSAGLCFLVRKTPPKFNRTTALELYYPYDGLSSASLASASISSSALRIVNTSVVVTPQASYRGYDTACKSTPDDITGNTGMGYWRSAQLWSPDDAEEGIEDFSNSKLSLNLQEALADCVINVSSEPWLWLEGVKISRSVGSDDPASKKDIMDEYNKGNMEGTLRYNIKRGWSIVWIRPPRLAVTFDKITGINCSDLQSVAGYVNPNEIVVSPAQITSENGLSGTCGGPIKEWMEDYGVIGDKDLEADQEYKPGLEHAMADGIELSCGDSSKIVYFPSMSDLHGVVKVTSSFAAQAGLGDNIGAGYGWLAIGNRSSKEGLQHTISITDVTPDNGAGLINIPNNIGGGSIGYSKYTATDFCCPIDGMLESLSASIGQDGISVSYSYRGLSPMPGMTQVRVANKALSRGSTTI